MVEKWGTCLWSPPPLRKTDQLFPSIKNTWDPPPCSFRSPHSPPNSSSQLLLPTPPPNSSPQLLLPTPPPNSSSQLLLPTPCPNSSSQVLYKWRLLLMIYSMRVSVGYLWNHRKIWWEHDSKLVEILTKVKHKIVSRGSIYPPETLNFSLPPGGCKINLKHINS